jgi:ATP-dependent DNA helicase RecQ
MRIVSGQEKLEMAKFYQAGNYRQKAKAKVTVTVNPDDVLLDNLKVARAEAAKKDNLAPYMVLSDASLLDIVKRKPLTLEDFSSVYGVGEVKAVRYWRTFVNVVRKAKNMKTARITGTTYRETLMLHQAGKSIAEIAEAKGVAQATIYGHFAKLIDEGKITDFKGLITREQYQIFLDAMRRNPANALHDIAPLLPAGMPTLALAISRALANKKRD